HRAGGCVGQFCAKSPYCDQNWHHTGARLMANLANDMVGQWDQIDRRGIKGDDNVPDVGSFNPPDHGRCDAIISLGDMADIDDPIVVQDPSYAQLGTMAAYQNAQYQIDAVADFWKIIDKSGVPYITDIGNHDPNQTFVDLMTTRLNYSKNSFYYDKSASG